MPTFADLLRQQRTSSGMRQRAVARASGINPAIVNRLESGERGPSGPEQVRALASALGLGPTATDDLLAAAGFWPSDLLAVGPGDPTLRKVAAVLARGDVSPEAKERFRQIVDLLVGQWLEAPR